MNLSNGILFTLSPVEMKCLGASTWVPVCELMINRVTLTLSLPNLKKVEILAAVHLDMSACQDRLNELDHGMMF
jgi:hypothetical protein